MVAAALGYVSATHARWLATAPDQAWRATPATLVFADVSGFTAMSEKLAKRGKIGAEETTEAVNRVFGGLLDATRACGGEILKFGGDAVLASFEGEGHEARGAAAALGMQRSMKPLRRLRTAAGTVSLRLSTGVASGTAHFLLAGEGPRELLVAGPLASEVVACESAAEAGQVVASPATLAALEDRCAGEALGPGRLLTAAPPVPAADVPALPTGFDPGPALPQHLHDHEPGDGEHRFASVAFIQFKGTDALCREDPARLAAVLDDLIGAIAERCRATGVTFVSTDVDRDGGKVILCAGAPTASPDDEDRLVHVLRDVVARRWALPVRAGVNRGRIFMVDLGRPERRVWSVMGDAVNLAARVMGRAEPGQVLATPSVLERLRDDYERTPVEPFMVKGKAAPVQAAVLGAVRAGQRAPAPRPAGAVVGRDAELAVLRGALDAARGGADRVVQLVGEPGIGKSRLLEAALAEAHGTTVVAVAGGPYAAFSAYRALRAPLRALLGTTDAAPDGEVAAALARVVAERTPSLAPWLPLVGIPFGLELPPTPETAELSPEFARARLQDATGAVLGALLADRPLLLVVEDAHWLDEASGELLAHLVEQPSAAGRLVLLTRRDVLDGLSLDGRPHTTTLVLQPLGTEAALELAGAVEEDALAPAAVATLVERAGGNPLLLQELLAAARAGQPLDALPDSIEALVMSRVDTLPPRDRHVLRQAAVLGVRVPLALLHDVLGLDGPAAAATLERLDGFLVQDGPTVVRFRHALLRDAAYEALPFRRRRQLHGDAAELIERTAGPGAAAQAEILALHFHAAHRWEPTWRYARLAADQALLRAAPVEAAGFLDRALEAGRALRTVAAGELAETATRLGDAAQLAGQPERAAEAYARARRHRAGDPLATADLCFKEGRIRDGSRHVTQALRWYTKGLRVLEDAADGRDTAALRSKLVLAHGAARMRAGRLRESLPYLHRAVAEAQSCGARDTLAHAYYCLDAVLTDLGTPDPRFRELALPIYEELGDLAGQAKVLCNLGIDAYYEGRWNEAVELYERSRQACARIGDVVQDALNASNMGEIRSDQGRFDEAEALFREALPVFRAAGFELGVATVYGNLGRLATRRGDPDGAGEWLRRAALAFNRIGGDAARLDHQVWEAERLLADDRPAEALALAGRVRETAHRLGGGPTLFSGLQRVAGAAKLALGDAEGARERLREAVDFARSVEAAYEAGLALSTLGAAGGPGAEQAAAEGRRILGALGVLPAAGQLV